MPTPPAAPMSKHKTVADLSDKLLRDVFVHLSTGADIIRSAASCARFLGVAASPEFRGHFRRRRGASTASFLAVIAHPRVQTDPIATVPGAAARISLEFLPDHNRLSIADSRDGRLLLVDTVNMPKKFFICNPLARSYAALPPTPRGCDNYYYYAAGFIPEESSHDFRAVVLLRSTDPPEQVILWVYDSKTGKWATGGHVVNFPMPKTRLLLRPPSVLAYGAWHLLFHAKCVVRVDVDAMRAYNIPIKDLLRDNPWKLSPGHVLGKDTNGELYMAVQEGPRGIRVLLWSHRWRAFIGTKHHALDTLFHPWSLDSLNGFVEASSRLLVRVNDGTLRTFRPEDHVVRVVGKVEGHVDVTGGFAYEMEWPPTSQLPMEKSDKKNSQ